MSIHQDTIKRFAQEVLGCGCPDAVFHSIHHNEPESLGWAEVQRLDIGNRLLVYLVSANDTSPHPTELSDLLAVGREDRDRNGFNRLRLALFGLTAEQWLSDPGRWVNGLYPGDDKIHLHILPAQQYPAI